MLSGRSRVVLVVLTGGAYVSAAFLSTAPCHATPSILFAQGFGKSSNSSSSGSENGNSSKKKVEKTYGESARCSPIKDMIDSEAAMQEFFTTREEWLPLFRSMANDSCMANGYLSDINAIMSTSTATITTTATWSSLEFHETSSPWKKLTPIPQEEQDRKILSNFLDSMQQALIDIPVTESETDDENDLHFLEEGRRILALSRFHVLRDIHGGSGVESYDALFATCWSEIMELSSSEEEHTGSLILLPDYELTDLRRFADMNLQRPLEWLGVHRDYEIATMELGSPAIRLLYKLNDMPDVPLHEVERMSE